VGIDVSPEEARSGLRRLSVGQPENSPPNQRPAVIKEDTLTQIFHPETVVSYFETPKSNIIPSGYKSEP